MSLARFKILVLITIVVKQLAKIGHTFINKVRLAACDEVKSRFLGKLSLQLTFEVGIDRTSRFIVSGTLSLIHI